MKNERFKIIGFDGWTLGAHHFERISKPLKKLNVDLFLLHLGSYGDEKREKKHETIGDLEVRDISFYNGLNFEQILKKEKPDLVILLSTETFLHRAFLRYCNKLGIPTLYHFHGILSMVYNEYSSKGVNINKHYNKSIYSHLNFILKRLPKAIKYTLSIYIVSLIKTKASLNDYVRFLKDIYYGFFGKVPLQSATDSITSFGFVFIPSDIKYMAHKCRIPEERISIIGNPDFDRFKLNESHLGSMIKSNSYEIILYVDTAFYLNGLHFSDIKSYVKYLKELQLKLIKLEKKLIVNPHPATIKSNGTNYMNSMGIETCSNDEFIPLLMKSKACICEPSSVFLIPSLMGIQIILPQIGSLKNQLYSNFILSYPRRHFCYKLSELEDIFNYNYDEKNISETKIWIKNNSGPKPLKDVSVRASKYIIDILHNESRTNVK